MLTQRVEDDAGFQDGNVDHVGAGSGRHVGVSVSLDIPGLGLGLVPLDEAAAEVLDEER